MDLGLECTYNRKELTKTAQGSEDIQVHGCLLIPDKVVTH